ncbi:60S ribosomal protein L16 [Fusarium oxysporum f. sp. albedinis]|nr:60S ribosomal protein L16 [Fusarium oxysporum f. sp. albedinis]
MEVLERLRKDLLHRALHRLILVRAAGPQCLSQRSPSCITSSAPQPTKSFERADDAAKQPTIFSHLTWNLPVKPNFCFCSSVS